MHREQIPDQPAQQRLQLRSMPKHWQQDCKNRRANTRIFTSGPPQLQTSKRHSYTATGARRTRQEGTQPLPNAGDDGRTHRAGRPCGIQAQP